MKKLILTFNTILLLFLNLNAQTDTLPNENKLGEDLLKGKFDFHLRSFWMHTENRGALLDYQTLAKGAGLGYYSPSWKGFHFGFSGFFVFQIYQINLHKADPITQNGNRYEIMMYDMNNFRNDNDLDRLEDFYLSYEKSKFKLVFGRQKINTPFLNEQDNRMRANVFNGFTAEYNFKKIKIYGAWLNAATLRGTVHWYGLGKSVGVYPFGRNPFGSSESYKNNTSTLGIGINAIEWKKENEKFINHFQIWNYYAQNMFNLSFFQNDFKYLTNLGVFNIGFQGFYQNTVGEGGNSNPILSYRMPNENTFGVGGQLEWKYKKHKLSINNLYTHNSGRFLFPREWGREHFYVNLSRERVEGNGGVNAYTILYSYLPIQKNLDLQSGFSKVDMPSVNDVKLNKYGVPSYYHLMFITDYKFKGYLEGLDIKMIVAHKLSQRPDKVKDENRINRVDLWNLSCIIDYRF
jgi:hypothetical protein